MHVLTMICGIVGVVYLLYILRASYWKSRNVWLILENLGRAVGLILIPLSDPYWMGGNAERFRGYFVAVFVVAFIISAIEANLDHYTKWLDFGLKKRSDGTE